MSKFMFSGLLGAGLLLSACTAVVPGGGVVYEDDGYRHRGNYDQDDGYNRGYGRRSSREVNINETNVNRTTVNRTVVNDTNVRNTNVNERGRNQRSRSRDVSPQKKSPGHGQTASVSPTKGKKSGKKKGAGSD